MTNAREYTNFKKAFTESIMQKTELGISTRVVDDEEFAGYALDGIETPQTSLMALFGYWLAKGGGPEVWDAMIDKAISEMSYTPVLQDATDMLLSSGLTKDDITPMIFPRVVSTKGYSDTFDLLVHREVLDVTFLYTIALASRGDGCPVISTYVTHEMMEEFDLDEDEVYEAATENLQRISFVSNRPESGSMLITAADGAFPASVLPYIPGGLDSAAKILETDRVYVVPLSDKAVSLVKADKDHRHEDLKSGLKKAHKKCYSGNVISDEVYLYSEGGLKLVR